MSIEPVTAAAAATNRVPERKKVAFDQHQQLLTDYKEAQASMAFWERRKKALYAQIVALLGDAEEATVDGQLALTYHGEQRINGSEFQARYPDLWKLYQKSVVKEELDVAALKAQQPEIYAEFQVQSMRVTFDPSSAS